MTNWLTDWLTNWLTGWPTDWLTEWLTDWLMWLTDWLTDWLTEAVLRDFLQKLSFEDQKPKLLCETSFKNEALKLKSRNFCARLPSKMKLWRSKTKHFCEIPSKMKLWSSKTKLLCETSFKNEALKIKNEAFLRDFLQKWSFEAQKRSFCARLPSKMKLWRSKAKLLCETSFKNDTLTGHLTSEFQYVLTIFKWMLQKYCGCHEKVEPRHTKSCNCHAKWSLQSNTSAAWNFATLPRIQRRRLQTSTSQSTKSLPLPRETHRFGASSNPPRLPTFLQPSRTPAPATHFETYRNPCACHAKSILNLKKWSEHLVL